MEAHHAVSNQQFDFIYNALGYGISILNTQIHSECLYEKQSDD
uniref:Uncharacterized protein n=1 Tax=Anguilla anguilla TaxID=7936 RepID=A0A0E9PDH7_ANGAN